MGKVRGRAAFLREDLASEIPDLAHEIPDLAHEIPSCIVQVEPPKISNYQVVRA